MKLLSEKSALLSPLSWFSLWRRECICLFKGFVLNEKGEIVLVKAAHAQDEAPAPAPVIPANYAMPEGMTMGKADAPIALYEFSSFGCFHCADFHLNVLPAIKEKYIDKGLVKLVFVPFPIDRASMDGALLAACVPADKYFAFVDVLFKKQREWGCPGIRPKF